jgi:hypothetical protein
LLVTHKRKQENEQNERKKRLKASELTSKENSERTKQTEQPQSLSNEIPTHPQPSVEENFLKCIDSEADDETQHSPALSIHNFATRDETSNLFDKTQTIAPTLQPTHALYTSLDFHEPCLSAAPVASPSLSSESVIPPYFILKNNMLMFLCLVRLTMMNALLQLMILLVLLM